MTASALPDWRACDICTKIQTHVLYVHTICTCKHMYSMYHTHNICIHKHALILHTAHTQHNTSHKYIRAHTHAHTHTNIPYHAQVLGDGMTTLLALSRSARRYTVSDINRERVPPFSSHTVDHHRQKESWEYVSTVEKREQQRNPDYLRRTDANMYVGEAMHVRTYIHMYVHQLLQNQAYVCTLRCLIHYDGLPHSYTHNYGTSPNGDVDDALTFCNYEDLRGHNVSLQFTSCNVIVKQRPCSV